MVTYVAQLFLKNYLTLLRVKVESRFVNLLYICHFYSSRMYAISSCFLIVIFYYQQLEEVQIKTSIVMAYQATAVIIIF